MWKGIINEDRIENVMEYFTEIIWILLGGLLSNLKYLLAAGGPISWFYLLIQSLSYPFH